LIELGRVVLGNTKLLHNDMHPNLEFLVKIKKHKQKNKNKKKTKKKKKRSYVIPEIQSLN
jgi:hypothetical protein